MFFILKIVTKNSILVNYFVTFLKKTIFKRRFLKFFTLLCYFFNPKKRKIFSVLKSPHINKTAQQQFKILKLFLTIKIKTFEFNLFLYFFKKIIGQLFLNFNKVITLLFKKKSIKNLFVIFNPIKFKVNFFTKYKKPKIYLYLKLFNIFGSMLFLKTK